MSAAGGLPKAVERAVALGCEALQVFTKNANRWQGHVLEDETLSEFRRAARKARLLPVAAHAAYLINLACPEPVLRAKAVSGLVDELERCDRAGIAWLVLHPGSHGGAGEDAGIDLVARGLDEAFVRAGGKTTVLLESAAGQGACLGHDLRHLSAIRERASGKARIAYCLDTCHLHAAGHDLVTKDGWKALMDEIDATLGIAKVKLVHANDSKRERGSRVDRHERIGHGKLGEAAFGNLMTEPAFVGVPKVLETPKDKEGLWDLEGIGVLRRLAGDPEWRRPAPP
jgi:deoxyribonuclease-4